MGYGGKFVERERAKELRARSWTLQEIATELGVAKGSVSVWVRDVEFTPRPRNRGHSGHQPHRLHLKKLAEIEQCRAEAEARYGEMSVDQLDTFALGLYAGEGAKTPGAVSMANTNPLLLRLFVDGLRRNFEIDEKRLRARLYLHEGLDLGAATAYWSAATSIPERQFQRPYRAVADPSRRHTKHERGCLTIVYHCSVTHRRVMASVAAITSRFDLPG
jgi:transcriptional regulator with XRE-family HTH domain